MFAKISNTIGLSSITYMVLPTQSKSKKCFTPASYRLSAITIEGYAGRNNNNVPGEENILNPLKNHENP